MEQIILIGSRFIITEITRRQALASVLVPPYTWRKHNWILPHICTCWLFTEAVQLVENRRQTAQFGHITLLHFAFLGDNLHVCSERKLCLKGKASLCLPAVSVAVLALVAWYSCTSVSSHCGVWPTSPIRTFIVVTLLCSTSITVPHMKSPQYTNAKAWLEQPQAV
jgi:hypothetical protein